jgi:uncharacterized SAM-binding protein YcdF (DUF218 family)
LVRVPFVVVPALFVGGVFAWSEWAHWRASGRRLGRPLVAAGREAILVLGCRNRGVRANYLNRYRVRVALRSIDPHATESVLIFCGGAVGGEVPEADLLLRHARDVLGYDGPYFLDRRSRTTWENIANTANLLERFDTVKIASNSLHAEKARAYLWKQRPDLAERLTAAKDFRLGEIALVKPVTALLGVRNLRRLSD